MKGGDLSKSVRSSKKKNDEDEDNSIRLLSNNINALNIFMEYIQKEIDNNKMLMK